jgi:hypothetical protein
MVKNERRVCTGSGPMCTWYAVCANLAVGIWTADTVRKVSTTLADSTLKGYEGTVR